MAKCYDTHLIITNQRVHIEFDERDPRKCTDEVPSKVLARFGSKKMSIEIPKQTMAGVHGFKFLFSTCWVEPS